MAAVPVHPGAEAVRARGWLGAHKWLILRRTSQVGILALGSIRKVPAVIETPEGDLIGIRHKMIISHSYDHRVVNGALGSQFAKRIADYLEAWDQNASF